MNRSPMKRGKSKRTRDFAAELDAITPVLFDRAGWRCEVQQVPICAGTLHRHHKLRRSHGGTNDLTNLLVACTDCHEWIHAHPNVSYHMGWLVRGVR